MVRVGTRTTFALGRGEGQARGLDSCGRPVLLRPIREHLALLLLRELQVLLAEKAEAWPLRAVTTSRKAAAHVALPSPTRGCRSVLTIAGSRRRRHGGRY